MRMRMNEVQMRAEFEDWWKQEMFIKLKMDIHEIITHCERTLQGGYVHAATAMRWEGWKAAIASQTKSVPEGYVLVPIEPTDEMVEAAARHYESGDYTGIRSTYKVMLAASPQHPIDDRVRELEAKYKELLMAVARKYPNETRHQTALRYINNAEVTAERAMKGGQL